MTSRPVALVTGVGAGLGSARGIAEALAASGWDVAFSYLTGYDARMPWGPDADARAETTAVLEGHGARVLSVEADLQNPDAPARADRRGRGTGSGRCARW